MLDFGKKNDNKSESNGFNQWLVQFFIKSINAVSTEQDRLEILAWLTLVREILNNSNLNALQKANAVRKVSDLSETVKILLNSLKTSIDNYKQSDMPLAVKIALPVTLAAATVVGGAGAGIAGFGSAIGVPLLLLVFVGVAGITAILEGFVGNKQAQSYIGAVMALIVRDEIYRRATKPMQQVMTAEPIEPKAVTMPNERQAIYDKLMSLSPYDFEQHVMAFFQQTGWVAWVTKPSNDFGVDGFAKHPDGLIVVQCKRNALDNLVGRPVVQQFKGVVEEKQAYHGYIVTTSGFTREAIESAKLNDKLVLVDRERLIDWHFGGVK